MKEEDFSLKRNEYRTAWEGCALAELSGPCMVGGRPGSQECGGYGIPTTFLRCFIVQE